MQRIHINLTPVKCGKMSYDEAMQWEREDYRVEQKMDGRRCFFAIQERGRVEARIWYRSGFRPMPKGHDPRPWHPHLIGSLFDGVYSTFGTPHYVVFDCLTIRGEDIRHLPLRQRREALDSVADFFPEGTYIIKQYRNTQRMLAPKIVWKDIEAPYAKSNWFVAEYGKSW